MTRDEQLIKAALDMAAMAAVTTPESRPGAPREWSDGFTSGCLHSADAIRAIDPADVLAKVGDGDVLPTSVTVKPLVWVRSHIAAWNGDWHTIPTGYTIRCADENGWKWQGGGATGFDISDSSAKAADQADYEARILAALTVTPQTASDAVAQLVEAEKDKACRLLISGFMLDCNAIGYISAAENLVRGIKEYVALAAMETSHD